MTPERKNPLVNALSRIRISFIPAGLFSMAINLLLLTTPIYMMQVYDRVFASSSLDTLLYLTIIAALAILVMVLLEVVRSHILLRVSAWLERMLGPETFARAIAAALWQKEYTTQALRDLATVRNFLSGAVVFSLFDALWVPLYLAVIYMMHPLLALIATFGALVLFCLALINEAVTRKPLETASGASLRAMRKAELASRNAEVVDSMGMLHSVVGRWEQDNQTAFEQQRIASVRAAAVLALTKFIRLGLQVAMLGTGAYLVIQSHVTPGVMIAASIILARALAPVEQAIGTWRNFVGYRTARRRLTEFFERLPLRSEGMSLPPPRGQLTVEGLTFIPPGADLPVLKRISFAAEPGEIVGVIGPSAAGKSSLARVLVGAWQPNGGAVRLDNAEMHRWPREELGGYIGYLPQDVELFPGTVRDNIARMGEGSPQEVVAAAQLAGVHEMILRLSNGYETEIGEGGARLSAGQRQRIALARAVFGAPRLVVLDEPNANLDGEGEMALARALAELRRAGTTVVLISHRQSILAQVDKILILRNGTVEMFGPRDEVLQALMPANKEALRAGARVATIAANRTGGTS